jgi:NTE family protein
MAQHKLAPSPLAQEIFRLKAANQLSVLDSSQLAARLEGVSIPAYADAVFEGGGVKGIALAGAIDVAEHLGVEWKRLAGTSAGAITACLLAAGYTAQELIPILTEEMDFKAFMDEGILDQIPLIGKLASAVFEKGIYEGDYFEEWMAEKLLAKGISTFAQLKDDNGDYRLKLIASDVTQQQMVILPDDLAKYGRIPDDFSVARAARMSMSIPYFFEPVEMDIKHPSKRRQIQCYIVDGGLLSNFPVWLFDVAMGQTPQWPTYGFKLVEPGSDEPMETHLPHQYIMSLVSTMMEAHDKAYIDQTNFKRTVAIPTMGIRTTQFDLNDEDKSLLLRAGQEAAIKFFKDWDFQAHNRERAMHQAQIAQTGEGQQ